MHSGLGRRVYSVTVDRAVAQNTQQIYDDDPPKDFAGAVDVGESSRRSMRRPRRRRRRRMIIEGGRAVTSLARSLACWLATVVCRPWLQQY